MNLIIALVALIIAILTMSSKRIQFVFRFLMSCVTSYWLLDLKFNGIRLLSDIEYTQENLTNMIDSGLAIWSVFFWIISFSIFHILIVFLLKKAFKNTFKKTFELATQKQIKMIEEGILKKTKKWIKQFKDRFEMRINKVKINENTIYNFRNLIINSLSNILHLLLVIYVLFGNLNYVALILFSVFIIAIIIYLIFFPIITYLKSDNFYKSVNTMLENESE